MKVVKCIICNKTPIRVHLYASNDQVCGQCVSDIPDHIYEDLLKRLKEEGYPPKKKYLSEKSFVYFELLKHGFDLSSKYSRPFARHGDWLIQPTFTGDRLVSVLCTQFYPNGNTAKTIHIKSISDVKGIPVDMKDLVKEIFKIKMQYDKIANET